MSTVESDMTGISDCKDDVEMDVDILRWAGVAA